MTGSDGKFIYGRGCCYGIEYELQVWGSGQEGTELGAYYGTINAPITAELDNGKESVLLYLPKHNKLIYWKWGSTVFYVAQGRPEPSDHMQLNWIPVYAERYGLPLDRVSLSNDASHLYILDYAKRQIVVVDGSNYRITRRIRLSALTHILAPGPNEDNHVFAFDGDYFYFGSDHGGDCYGIYTVSGEYAGVQCSRLSGSMLYYNWALGYYMACGTDKQSPLDGRENAAGNGRGAGDDASGSWLEGGNGANAPQPTVYRANAVDSVSTDGLTRVFNNGYGNGAHCSFWPGYRRFTFSHAAVCPSHVPVFGELMRDEEDRVWRVSQDKCRLHISFEYMTMDVSLEYKDAPASGGSGALGKIWSGPVRVSVNYREDPAYPGFETSMTFENGQLRFATGMVLTLMNGGGNGSAAGANARVEEELRHRLHARPHR